MSHRRLTAIALAITLLVPVACSDAGSADAAEGAATVEVVAGSPTELTVTWSADADAHRWLVVLSAPDGRSLGQRTACGACRSVEVQHLAPASDYAVRVIGVDEAGALGAFSDPVTATTPAIEGCTDGEATGTCVAVDAGAVIGEAVGVGLGGLHGVTSGTDPSAVAALEPRHWRVSAIDPERFALARAYGAEVTVLLSDAWISVSGLRAPWQDWAAYETFVGQVVDAFIASGTLPDYWEVQNEPGPTAYEGGDPPTVELVLEQHRRAAAQIHARLPDAAVVGPAPSFVTFGYGLGDIQRFADLAADGTLTAMSWHEIGGGCADRCDASPRAVLQHADDVRAALEEAGATAQLHVNEWGAPWNIGQPGAAIGYLASLSLAGVAVANPTCWPAREGDVEPSCRVVPGTLGGLLLEDGRTPTDAWHAHVAYARITGAGFRSLVASVADPQASVAATVDDAGIVRALLGRHTGCDPSVDVHCPPDFSYAPAEDVSLVLEGVADGTYAVSVERIGSTAGPSRGPVQIATEAVTASGGRVVAGPWPIEDGDAVLLTIARAT
jgi:hypothetical protein